MPKAIRTNPSFAKRDQRGRKTTADTVEDFKDAFFEGLRQQRAPTVDSMPNEMPRDSLAASEAGVRRELLNFGTTLLDSTGRPGPGSPTPVGSARATENLDADLLQVEADLFRALTSVGALARKRKGTRVAYRLNRLVLLLLTELTKHFSES